MAAETLRYLLHSTACRPDFRLLLEFVWGTVDRIDTEGDAQNPASKDWTELYARHRERPGEFFEVECRGGVVVVTATPAELAARVTLFLCEAMAGHLTRGESTLSRSDLSRACGPGFDVRTAFQRAQSSRWSRATLIDPFPAP